MTKQKFELHINIEQVYNDVFIYWYSDHTSGTLTLTPEQAISIGDIGKAAFIRKHGEERAITEGHLGVIL